MKKIKILFLKRWALLMFLSTAFFIVQVRAEDALDYSDMAKNRTYLGGAEESDLKVLPESYFQKNKKNSTEEVNEGF